MSAVCRAALDEAHAASTDIDAVSAAGSGSVDVDACEARALDLLFGDRAQPVPLIAVKAGLGETLGASGPLQLMAAMEAARSGCLPGVAGLESTDINVTHVDIRQEARPLRVNTTLIDAIGWDGHCCAIVIGTAANDA